MELKVYLFDKLAGTLKTTSEKGIVFIYDSKYLSEKNIPLSISIPLREKEFTQKECLPYFIGLLPEGNIKRRIAQNLHVSELSTVKLLEALGGECAGTVSFYPEESDSVSLTKKTWKLDKNNYRPISELEIFQMIQKNQERPLLHINDDLRLSLAGAQEKISLAFFDNSWHLPINGAPSTHILKPTLSKSLSTLAVNEFICMQFAKQMNLPVPETQLIYINELPIFVCERYDRKLNIKKNLIERLHQEDFCQALCIMSDNKYQSDGGPSLKNCLSLIQEKTSLPLFDTSIFLKAILFNYLIGNCDAHAKNFSIITKQDDSYRLSPLYDLVSTSIYDSLTRKMAMKLGNKYDIDMITRIDFNQQAEIFDIKPRLWSDELEIFSEKYNTSLQNVFTLLKEESDKEIFYTIEKGITERLNKLR